MTLRRDKMKKDSPLRYSEINNLLLELRELLPELEFQYSDNTGWLNKIEFKPKLGRVNIIQIFFK